MVKGGAEAFYGLRVAHEAHLHRQRTRLLQGRAYLLRHQLHGQVGDMRSRCLVLRDDGSHGSQGSAPQCRYGAYVSHNTRLSRRVGGIDSQHIGQYNVSVAVWVHGVLVSEGLLVINSG